MHTNRIRLSYRSRKGVEIIIRRTFFSKHTAGGCRKGGEGTVGEEQRRSVLGSEFSLAERLRLLDRSGSSLGTPEPGRSVSGPVTWRDWTRMSRRQRTACRRTLRASAARLAASRSQLVCLSSFLAIWALEID